MNSNNIQIICEIPARYGSQRLPHKNLKMLCGKKMIEYSINAAKKSRFIDRIYVNTENQKIGQVAIDSGVEFYRRDSILSGPNRHSDDFNYDFIKKIHPDILVMVNPVCPLITTDDIDKTINFFLKNKYNTVITVSHEYLQCFFKNQPVNVELKSKLLATQDLEPVQIINWAVTIWDAKKFVERYETIGSGVLSGDIGFFPISKKRAIKISTLDDFEMAEAILQYEKEKI